MWSDLGHVHELIPKEKLLQNHICEVRQARASIRNLYNKEKDKGTLMCVCYISSHIWCSSVCLSLVIYIYYARKAGFSDRDHRSEIKP